jgi:uncharacterized Zn-finger protein
MTTFHFEVKMETRNAAGNVECPVCGKTFFEGSYFEMGEECELTCPECEAELVISEVETVQYWTIVTKTDWDIAQAKAKASYEKAKAFTLECIARNKAEKAAKKARLANRLVAMDDSQAEIGVGDSWGDGECMGNGEGDGFGWGDDDGWEDNDGFGGAKNSYGDGYGYGDGFGYGDGSGRGVGW